LFEKWEQEKRTLIAPALLAFEVISSLRRILYLKELTTHESEEVFERFLRMDIRLSSRRSIFPLAWSLAKEFNRPRAYDSAYLALASLADCVFWTADERLYNAVKDRLPWVKWIGSSSLV
jgi:predicted nucleic acid-binding protein